MSALWTSISLTCPISGAAKELKTKPTQHSVKELQQLGIRPDVLILRTEHPIPTAMRRKIAQFCNVDPAAVIESLDCPSIYEVPVMLHKQGLDDIVCARPALTPPRGGSPHAAVVDFLDKMNSAEEEVTIGLVGKYVELQDAYKSINESLFQAATYNAPSAPPNISTRKSSPPAMPTASCRGSTA